MGIYPFAIKESEFIPENRISISESSGLARTPDLPHDRYGGEVNEHLEIRRRLAAIGKNRLWLAKQLKKSEETVRQYLQPKGKRTKELIEEIERVIVLEEARQRENQADAPPWNVLFKTADEFNLVDRASRVAKAETVLEFCRSVILQRAEELLAKKAADYRQLRGQRFKVADEKESK
jgi:hypothetical protein